MKEKTSPWFKVFALCTAIGLGGTYVWRQQQKAAPEIDTTVERMVLSGSKSSVITPIPLPVDQEEADRVLMPSSKSGGVFKTEHEMDNERTMMSGSKSGTIQLGPEIDLALPSPEVPNAPKLRTLLPGSKSIPMPIFRDRRLAPADQPKPGKP